MHRPSFRGARLRAGTVVALVLALWTSLLSGVTTPEAPPRTESSTAPGAASSAPRRKVPPRTKGFTGYAFDARCAPTQKQMDAWRTSSPFRAVGIYLGGSMVSCRPTATDPGQPHLTRAWVRRQRAKGWLLLPIWVGPQASCSGFHDRINPKPAGAYRAAGACGRREAAAAVARARELGLRAGSTLWYDLEGGFDLNDTPCRRSALRFLSGWTRALHARGYRSGVYSSVAAGIHALDHADRTSPGTYAMPDQVWYAWYNGRADLDPSAWVRPRSWKGQRVHQYQCGTDATYGGVTLNIDRNFVKLDGGSRAPHAVRKTDGPRLDFRHYPRLRTGAHGARVKALQSLLTKNGRYRGPMDATYDREVTRAVRTFQRHHGLRASGRADAATWTALFARGARPLLKVGSAGASSLRLQRALRAAGYTGVKPTGVVTDRTSRAVARHQRKLGMTPTGVVTPHFWRALQRGRR